jgi:hypothetical protein
LAGRKRVCIFSAKDVAKNVRERSNEEKEKQEGLIAKLNASNLCQRKFFETPLYDHVPGNKRDGTVIRTGYEKGEERKGGRGRYKA